MTNMENMNKQLADHAHRDAVYTAAMADIARENAKREANGYAVMAAALGYGESANGTGVFGKVSHAAKLFCILFAMLAPSLLIWGYLL